MVVPRLIEQALAGVPMTVYGDGSQTRSFSHVADVVAALLGLLDHPGAIGDVFNVGSQEEVSILELARRIVGITDSRSPIELVPYDKAYESGFEDMQRRQPDTTKLRLLTGWTPTRTLDQILRETVAEAAAHLGRAERLS